MKIELDLNNFKKAITTVSRVTSSKQQLPILGNILLKVEKSKLVLQATNLESSVSVSIPVKSEKEGEIAVPGRILLDVVLSLFGDNLHLSSEKEHLKIESYKFKSEILGMNTTDFPKIPDKIKKESFSVPLDQLKNALEKVLFAVSNDESRPVLTGILFEPQDNNNLVIVGTDGFRLSRKKISIKKGENFDRVIIPKSILYEILKIEGDGEVSFEVRKNDGQVVFVFEETVFSSRIIDGEYPPYQKIIPEGYNLKTFVDRDDLSKSVKLASVFSRDSGNGVKFQIKNNKLQIIAESSNSGKQETEVEIKLDEKSVEKDLTILFNYKFLEDILKAIKSDDIEIEFNGQDKAGKFLDPKDPDFLHLIMPIKAN